MPVRKEVLEGFSKLSSEEKREVISALFDDKGVKKEFYSYLYNDEALRSDFLGFSENTISSYHLPYNVLPNLLLDAELLHVPMVTEESSVVAAAAAAAKFWFSNGGIKTVSLTNIKVGQVHFISDLEQSRLSELIADNYATLKHSVAAYTSRMESRGGGIVSMQLLPTVNEQYQLMVEFKTANSMGANFINTCLEELSLSLKAIIESAGFTCDVLMSILSNYTPNCCVKVAATAPIAAFDGVVRGMDANVFADRFKRAVDIASSDIYRATTHNKGIMNGVDSVVIATGNDFRATEAAAHAYASRSGKYASLSTCNLSEGYFNFELELPLALGVVGGLTSLHPLAKRSLELLGNPNAERLMSIAAAVGIASNFAAIKSLITDGIQQGHMKMHLNNILKSYGATFEEVEKARLWFANRKVSNVDVKKFLDGQRE